MAPTSAKLIATFMPTKSAGSALGKRTFHRMRQALARWMRASASASGSTERRPSATSATIEKIASITAMAIFGSAPVPIQMTKSGASATLGSELRTTRMVVITRSAQREATMATASATPSTTESAKPASVVHKVKPAWRRK
jgi:hypothetical protein